MNGNVQVDKFAQTWWSPEFSEPSTWKIPKNVIADLTDGLSFEIRGGFRVALIFLGPENERKLGTYRKNNLD